jgi:hypothetical protein
MGIWVASNDLSVPKICGNIEEWREIFDSLKRKILTV